MGLNSKTQRGRSGSPEPVVDDPTFGGAYLEVDHIGISFTSRAGGQRRVISVLEDLTFSLEEGEFCCIVGPSGCGKSTTLRIIDGLQSPGAGVVRIAGTPVTEPRPEIAFVFQQFNLLPWRTIIDNVMFGWAEKGFNAIPLSP